MEADVNAAVTRKGCPEKQQDGRPWTEFPQGIGHESGYGERVGGMGGSETESSARQAFGKMKQTVEVFVETGSKSLKIRFEHMR